MYNQELAKIFYEIADYLAMDAVPFKPYAYQKAATALETTEEDVSDIYKRGGIKALEEISGVGKNIAERIEEYLKTGKMKYYEQFKKRLPLNLGEIISVEGVGPRKAKVLYQTLGVRNLKDLEKAAKSHKIAPLFGFGEKTEKNIIESIIFLKRSKGRFLLGEIFPQVKIILDKLKTLKEVKQASVAGSVRRMKETIGDVDILVTTKNPTKVMDFFVSLPGVVKIWAKGPTKSSVRMKDGFDVDIRAVQEKSYGSALQYFTGSKEHNIAIRRIAMDKGLKLSEYGLFRKDKIIAGWDEAGIYKAIGLVWVEPELRENQGEIEAALRQAQGRTKELPKIIGYKDIKGDLHCHSDWDGGENSIADMAKASIDIGYQYIGIADHTKFLRIEHGLDEKQLEKRNKEIDKLNESFKHESREAGWNKEENAVLFAYESREAKNVRSSLPFASLGCGMNEEENAAFFAVKNNTFRILKGAETNILNDGKIDIKDEALKKLDYVIAGIHSSLKMEKSKMTERIIRAMKNPNVDIISHPTGRILKARDEYQIDFDKILRAAKEYNVILEINAFPARLDLNDQNIRRAKSAGVKMAINTDAHKKDQLRFIEFGIAQARRGWAEKEDIINTQPLEKLLAEFRFAERK